ncbi:MAG: exodeoxyribonuclease III [Rickettsiales bacterium]
MSISVATWNVNSIRSRLPHLLGWLREDKPDIVLLQELKCTDDVFPFMEIEELGYNIAVYGEKSYNGVAILSKFPLDDISRGLNGNEGDTHSRYIEAVANLPNGAIRVASVYVPNGHEITSDKFSYKLSFLKKLQPHLKELLTYEEIFIIGGDYNIAPEDSDVHDPKIWENSVLTHDEVRASFRKIINSGIYDAGKILNQNSTEYSWWDYRGNSFTSDNGLRIDHLLLSPQAADKLTKYYVKKELRELEKPSDHAPVVGIFNC